MPFQQGGRGGASPYGILPPFAGGAQPQMGGPGGAAQANQFNKRMVVQSNGQPMPNGMQGQGQGQGQMGANRRTGPGGRGPQQGPNGGPNVRGQYIGMPTSMQQTGMAGRGATGVKFNSNVANVRNQGMGPQGGQGAMPVAPTSVPGLGEPLDDQALAQADPPMQKNMIGEKLYPLIYVHQQQLAGKITGMLLEMDNAELLNLIESPDALMHKIEEALLVLKNHQEEQ